VQGKVAANFVDAGEQSLKNMARPVRVYRLDLVQKIASASQAPRPTLALPRQFRIRTLRRNIYRIGKSRLGCDYDWIGQIRPKTSAFDTKD
jgi:hypothetical protein